jgi:hypothetical protein
LGVAVDHVERDTINVERDQRGLGGPTSTKPRTINFGGTSSLAR